MRLISTRRLVCLPGLVSRLVISVVLLLGAALWGWAFVTGRSTVLLLASPISVLGSDLMTSNLVALTFRALGTPNRHTQGSGPATCRVWQILSGAVWDGREKCRDSMTRNVLLVWTHLPVILMVVWQLRPVSVRSAAVGMTVRIPVGSVVRRLVRTMLSWVIVLRKVWLILVLAPLQPMVPVIS